MRKDIKMKVLYLRFPDDESAELLTDLKAIARAERNSVNRLAIALLLDSAAVRHQRTKRKYPVK